MAIVTLWPDEFGVFQRQLPVRAPAIEKSTKLRAKVSATRVTPALFRARACAIPLSHLAAQYTRRPERASNSALPAPIRSHLPGTVWLPRAVRQPLTKVDAAGLLLRHGANPRRASLVIRVMRFPLKCPAMMPPWHAISLAGSDRRIAHSLRPRRRSTSHFSQLGRSKRITSNAIRPCTTSPAPTPRKTQYTTGSRAPRKTRKTSARIR